MWNLTIEKVYMVGGWENCENKIIYEINIA